MSFTKDWHSSQRVRSTSNQPIDTSHSHYFNYTSGCWLINETHQLKTRHTNFNVPALQRIAGQLLKSRCVQMNKIPEGLFNKVFSFQMENGREILARVPNPNTGHAYSEVATLDFLRTVLKIPVPRVLSWSSSLQQVNPVGAEYILMERVKVEIEQKLVNAKFTLHSSLYYGDTFPHGRSIAVLGTADQKGQFKFILELETNKGPSIATSKISQIQNAYNRSGDVTFFKQFLTVLSYILLPEEVLTPVLLHSDLHHYNIFVDLSNSTRISSIINWQTGAVQPRLPKDFETLSPAAKKLKKFYKLAYRKVNPALVDAMDKIRDNSDPTTFIFHIVGRSSEDGPMPLKELLIQVFKKWDRIRGHRAATQPCPISFSRTEIEESRQQVEAWAAAFGEFDALRAEFLGDDGWVSHDDYEEAMSRWEKNKAILESLREQVETLV
ncbi:hypothetical protein BO86DRAFT_436103 [Aspergillus japonicus CBS 114.51]|uniref:Altered inheritance of mitochondria protein 9, mitochondrial n=1 Tax=Aspergillus japonicus CBS 114.51 TaxID=1448312 RepID=A0A8T8WUM7_ASPJA|nr:hypothetical protein BO86DRAFT_436103 [Aspergillus japonicus CBS 114.51]RAH79370.1 hypothetical protein BO86DRAFT_436103 [Aspergillus japonicus CBS 114.51]